MSKTIEEIIETRNARAPKNASPEEKSYSVISGEGIHENFLELKFRDGLKTCFAYNDLVFMNFDPDESVLDIEFGGFMVSVKGTGLGEKLFHHLKSKRVAWIREASSEFEENDTQEVYISEIAITPPEGFSEDAE